MIPRYTRPEMAQIWSDDTRYQIWLEVETLALEAMAKEGLAPQSSAETVRKNASVRPERVQEIEAEVHHDVIAFLTTVSESVGADARCLHRGMTSNDLLDTSFAVQLSRAGRRIWKRRRRRRNGHLLRN
jgi:adenylosuccinate lyase